MGDFIFLGAGFSDYFPIPTHSLQSPNEKLTQLRERSLPSYPITSVVAIRRTVDRNYQTN